MKAIREKLDAHASATDSDNIRSKALFAWERPLVALKILAVHHKANSAMRVTKVPRPFDYEAAARDLGDMKVLGYHDLGLLRALGQMRRNIELMGSTGPDTESGNSFIQVANQLTDRFTGLLLESAIEQAQ